MGDPLQPQPPSSWLDRALHWWRGSVRPRVSARTVVVAAAAGLAVAVGGWLFLRNPKPQAELVLPRADAGPTPAGPAASTSSSPSNSSSTTADATVTVAAAGAVARPGVYVLPARARVADVVAAAGGPLPDADLDQVNLAAKVSDADRVYVPRRGQPVPAVVGPGAAGGVTGAAGAGSPATTSGPLDLNAASVEQLDGLPGVGPALARAIVQYRDRHGPFRSVSQLVDVAGIGPAKLEILRPLVRVSS